MAGVGERTASDEGKESVSLLRADSGSTAPPKRQHGWREVVITVGAALIALLSNTPTAFNAISGQFKDDVGASITPLFLSVFLGAGVAGLQFTLLAGLLIDRAGAVVGTVVGGIGVCGGYMAMSYTTNSWLLLLEYATVSLASGCTFLAALRTSFEIGHAAAIGLVSLTMSLSISFTVFINKGYNQFVGCSVDTPGCWRDYVRAYAVLGGAAFVLGAITLLLRRSSSREDEAADNLKDALARAASGHEEESQPQSDTRPAKAFSMGEDQTRDVEDGAESMGGASSSRSRATAFDPRVRLMSTNVPMTFTATLGIFRKPFFWSLVYANLAGVSSGILILTSALQMWEEYNTDETKEHWNQLITIYFSAASGIANVIAPLVSDHLHSKGILRRSRLLATILAICATNFVALGVLTIIPHQHHGDCALKMAFVFLLAVPGFGFGSYLTLFPTVLEDTYGIANFGVFMSYMQVGSTVFAILVPIAASAIKASFGSYNSLYWSMAGMLFLGAAAIGLPTPRSFTFGKSG